LERDLEALAEQCGVDRPREVEPSTNRAGGGEDLVSAELGHGVAP